VNITNEEALLHRKKMLLSMIIPLIFIFLMWILKITEVLFNLDLTHLGILPLTLEGIPGILLSPFVHGDFRHLFYNR
jgi:membrane associated rhomboid family serine protease